MQTTTCPKTETPKLSATEKKLLEQIQAQTPAKPSWVTFLGNASFGFW